MEHITLGRPEDHHRLGVVVALEDTALAAVQLCQGCLPLYLELVVRAPVVDVVAEAGDQQGQPFHLVEVPPDPLGFQGIPGEVGHGEGMGPVMIGHVAVAVGHAEDKIGQDVLSDTVDLGKAEILKFYLNKRQGGG